MPLQLKATNLIVLFPSIVVKVVMVVIVVVVTVILVLVLAVAQLVLVVDGFSDTVWFDYQTFNPV